MASLSRALSTALRAGAISLFSNFALEAGVTTGEGKPDILAFYMCIREPTFKDSFHV